MPLVFIRLFWIIPLLQALSFQERGWLAGQWTHGGPVVWLPLQLEREKAQLKTLGSPVSKFEGNALNYDSGLEIPRDGIIHRLLPRCHWSWLCSHSIASAFVLSLTLRPQRIPRSWLLEAQGEKDIRPRVTSAWALPCHFRSSAPCAAPHLACGVSCIVTSSTKPSTLPALLQHLVHYSHYAWWNESPSPFPPWLSPCAPRCCPPSSSGACIRLLSLASSSEGSHEESTPTSHVVKYTSWTSQTFSCKGGDPGGVYVTKGTADNPEGAEWRGWAIRRQRPALGPGLDTPTILSRERWESLPQWSVSRNRGKQQNGKD